jgi:hypothetical protein
MAPFDQVTSDPHEHLFDYQLNCSMSILGNLKWMFCAVFGGVFSSVFCVHEWSKDEMQNVIFHLTKSVFIPAVRSFSRSYRVFSSLLLSWLPTLLLSYVVESPNLMLNSRSSIRATHPSMTTFARLTESEVEVFVKAVNKLPAVAAGGAPAAVPHIPFGSIKNLKAMRRYAIDCRRLGLRLVHNRFDLVTMNGLNARMDFEAQLKINEVKPPPLPEKFVSFTKWHKFSEGFTGHCSVLRGCHCSFLLGWTETIYECAHWNSCDCVG